MKGKSKEAQQRVKIVKKHHLNSRKRNLAYAPKASLVVHHNHCSAKKKKIPVDQLAGMHSMTALKLPRKRANPRPEPLTPYKMIMALKEPHLQHQLPPTQAATTVLQAVKGLHGTYTIHWLHMQVHTTIMIRFFWINNNNRN